MLTFLPWVGTYLFLGVCVYAYRNSTWPNWLQVVKWPYYIFKMIFPSKD